MISVVLRAKNERYWIGRCLTAIRRQRLNAAIRIAPKVYGYLRSYLALQTSQSSLHHFSNGARQWLNS